MTQVTPDPRPEKRIKASAVEWTGLRSEKLGPCRVCGVRTKDLHLHHLVGRDLSGDDVADNLVPLCPGHHGQVEHRHPVACGKLRASLTESELLYVAKKKGWDFLDRYYSPLDATVAVAGGNPDDGRVERDFEPGGDNGTPPGDEPSTAGELTAYRSASTCPRCGQTVKTEPSGSPAEPDVVKAKATGAKEPARRKRSWRIAVPHDAEDGKAVLDGLVEACRVELAPTLGYEDETIPPYFVLTAVMAAFLRGERAAA